MALILIAENSEALREELAATLNDHGYKTITANNGSEALSHLIETKPNLILSDIKMPELDGYEFLKSIKRSATYANIPFIFLSGIDERDKIRFGMNLGADDYIIKPVHTIELLTTIESNLKKYEQRNKEVNFIKENIIKYIPHELRTPLVSILGLSELLMKEFDQYTPKEIGEIASQINKAGLRLHNTIDKFILLIELTNEQFDNKRKFEIIKTNQTITSTINKVQIPNSRIKDIEINIEESYILFSERYISIVLTELLNNAIKFSRSSTKIKITGAETDDYYLLTIKDNGIGMSKTELLGIDAFKQFNRDEFQQEGNGLGLAIIKQIMTNTNTKMTIESEPGKYTKVSLKLKIASKAINKNIEYNTLTNIMEENEWKRPMK